MNDYVEDREMSFLYMPNEKLREVLVKSGLTYIFMCIFVSITGKTEITPFLFISSVNCICTLIFIKYTKIRIGYLLSLICVHLLSMVIFYFYVVTLPINIMQGFQFGGNILYEVNIIFTTVLIHLIINVNKRNMDKNPSVIIVKYFFTIIISSVLLFFFTNNLITYSFFRVTAYINDILLLTSSVTTINKGFNRGNDIEVSRVIIVTLIVVDIISFCFGTKLNFIWLLYILRFLMVNLFIYIFIYSVFKINNRIQFKNMNDITNNLIQINNELHEKNKLLEVWKNDAFKLDNMYKDFLQIIDMPIIIFNQSNNRIKYANNKFLILVNKTKLRDIINKKIGDFININAKKISTITYEKNETVLSFLENEGEIRVLELSLASLINKEIIVIINDITEKENMYKLKRKIIQKRRNEIMKKNFLSNISHDLKTPIGVIYSAIQLQEIYINTEDKSEIARYNHICIDNCVYLNRLTNNIMDISRISEKSLIPKLELGNIVYFIEEKVQFINEAAKINNVNIIFDTEEEEMYVFFDKEFTERIILNLLSNSIKYSNVGSEVNVYLWSKDNRVFISIIDNGVGMSKDFVSKAFDLYTMESENAPSDTRKLERGTGIGLYVVYNLVKLQRADINVESEIGKGSKFTISFLREITNG